MPHIKRPATLVFLTLFVLATGCTACSVHEVSHVEAPAHVAEKPHHEKEPSHGAKPHWGYEGAEGPEAWGTLCPEFATCSSGKNQSPIDITGATIKDLPDITFNYNPTNLNILNNGHTIQVNYDEGSSIEAAGSGVYQLKQFHFHTPSEHTVDGKHYPMEMHLVHQNSDGALAVVGVMIEKDTHNQAFSPVWDNLPAEPGEELHPADLTVDAGDLLPGKRLYYRYDGSLTTPPCSEGVKWFVLTTPVGLCESQLSSFRAIIHDNNRPVQPLNDREVLVDTSLD